MLIIQPELVPFCVKLEHIKELKNGDSFILAFMKADILYTANTKTEVITKYTPVKRTYYHFEGLKGTLDNYEPFEFKLLIGNKWVSANGGKGVKLLKYPPEAVLGDGHVVIPCWHIDDFLETFDRIKYI